MENNNKRNKIETYNNLCNCIDTRDLKGISACLKYARDVPFFKYSELFKKVFKTHMTKITWLFLKNNVFREHTMGTIINRHFFTNVKFDIVLENKEFLMKHLDEFIKLSIWGGSGNHEAFFFFLQFVEKTTLFCYEMLTQTMYSHLSHIFRDTLTFFRDFLCNDENIKLFQIGVKRRTLSCCMFLLNVDPNIDPSVSNNWLFKKSIYWGDIHAIRLLMLYKSVVSMENTLNPPTYEYCFQLGVKIIDRTEIFNFLSGSGINVYGYKFTYDHTNIKYYPVELQQNIQDILIYVKKKKITKDLNLLFVKNLIKLFFI